MREAAAPSDYLSAVMELCSLRRSLSFLPPQSSHRGSLPRLFSDSFGIQLQTAQTHQHRQAFLLFARMLRSQLRPLKAP